MARLNDYLKQTQRFLRDAKQEFSNPADLISYVNRARREIAMRSQSIRRLTPVSAQIVSWNVTDGGSGYTDPMLSINAPDFPSGQLPNPNGLQATAAAILSAGVITAIDSQIGGAGYFQPPTMTITDATGSGATAEATLGYINTLNIGQEVYPFSEIDMSMYPGVGQPYYVRSASVIFSNYRYIISIYSFTEYQAKIRQYTPNTYQYVPCYGAQFGQGTEGSLYLYPTPSQSYQTEWDCLCIPADLTTNDSEEALPSPWTDAVPYFSAALAYEELQNLNAARYYHDQYDKMAQRYSNYARVGRTVAPYGRY